MSTRSLTAIVGVLGVLSCTGCVMPDQMSKIQKDLADVKAQIATLRQDQSATQSQLAAIDGTSRRPEPDSNVASREQMADIDVQVHQAVRNSEINEERLGDLQRQVERIARELDETRDMAQRGTLMVPPRTASPDGDDPTVATDTDPYARGTVPAGGSAAVDPDELYNTAYADFSKGNYELAVAGFEEFYDEFPRSAVADNALYWVGECYFSQGDFPLAIRAFDRMLEVFPESDKAAAGNLKKGLAYLEQNQVRQAIVQLQHVNSAYSGSDEARVARDKLTALGAPI